MNLSKSIFSLLMVLVTMAARACRTQQLDNALSLRFLSSTSRKAVTRQAGRHAVHAEPGDNPSESHPAVPAVFLNGAWTSDHSTNLNAYVASLLSKDVYVKHMIDPKNGRAAQSNFTLLRRLFCRAMSRLGADDCEVVSGAESLVWAVVRAGPSVLLVIRGSNTPQNWLADITSLRMINVADFGGGRRGTNVALGFYKVFSANRQSILSRVREAIRRATNSTSNGNSSSSSTGSSSSSSTGNSSSSSSTGNSSSSSSTGNSSSSSSTGNSSSSSSSSSSSNRDTYGITTTHTATTTTTTSPRLWVFGHSLGGAVALMAASYMNVREGLTPTGVYTFGGPRAGDESWSQSYNQLHDVTLRLENAGDVIPMLPFGAAWRHVGSAVAIQACRSPELLLGVVHPAVAAAAAADLTAAPTSETAAAGVVPGIAKVELEGGTAATAAVHRRRRRQLVAGYRWELRGGGGSGGECEDRGVNPTAVVAVEVVEAEAVKADLYNNMMLAAAAVPDVEFPFPVFFRDHWIQTYVRVMWSCLPESDQDLVPGPEDVYDKLDVALIT